MSFDAREDSIDDGAPLWLYRFTLGAEVWTYTNGDIQVTWNGETYAKSVLSHSDIELTQEQTRQPVEVTLPRDHPIIALASSTPDGILYLTIYGTHRGDGEFVRCWKGRVLRPQFRDGDALLNCEPIATALKRGLVKLRYSVPCRHLTYGVGCYVEKESFVVEGIVTAVNGAQVQCAAFATKPDGWLAGGWLVWEAQPRRMILTHIGDTVILIAALSEMGPGDAVRAYAGDDRSFATCRDKFDNSDNYGGFKDMPGRNPFDPAGGFG